MNFNDLTTLIHDESLSNRDFTQKTETVKTAIFESSRADFISIIAEIGVIPEPIEHDSSEEKLFAKATDIVMARAFDEIGINSRVYTERADCADVVGKSRIHDYTLVGDAKAFRLSRTAKNQKDFKVKSMVDWRADNNYAVLACPYYQYPTRSSQIYSQAIDGNVCLFSWEQFCFLLENNIKETESLSLAPLWNISQYLSERVFNAATKLRSNYSEIGMDRFCETLQIDRENWDSSLLISRDIIIHRGEGEIEYWERKIEEISNYTRDQAIGELLSALKLNEKISSIRKYIDGLRCEAE